MNARRARPVAGGGIQVEVPASDLVGWVNRFAARNTALVDVAAAATALTLTAMDGTTAVVEVPFPPLELGDREPIEALLEHLRDVGVVGLLCVRARGHAVGIARGGVVLQSKTAREYVQGRTAAGGWSQQRYARRRANQRTESLEHAADVAARILLARPLHGLVLAGDRAALDNVLSDRRLAPLADLPRRTFADVGEPRRAVLDELARRTTAVRIVIDEAAGSPGSAEPDAQVDVEGSQ